MGCYGMAADESVSATGWNVLSGSKKATVLSFGCQAVHRTSEKSPKHLSKARWPRSSTISGRHTPGRQDYEPPLLPTIFILSLSLGATKSCMARPSSCSLSLDTYPLLTSALLKARAAGPAAAPGAVPSSAGAAAASLPGAPYRAGGTSEGVQGGGNSHKEPQLRQTVVRAAGGPGKVGWRGSRDKRGYGGALGGGPHVR